MISRLASTSSLPWCMGGDFNEIIHSDEKRGGRKPVRSYMEEFFQCLRGADLWDIRPKVGWFSWASGTRAKTYVCKRIDRFVAKNDWRLKFQDCSIETIPMAMSDHSAILLKMVGEERICDTRKDYFKFDFCWANEDQCPITDVNCELRRKALVDLKEVMDKDENYWFQRSRVAWLKDGDRNSSFFHARANGRRKKNRIEGLLTAPDEEILQAIDRCVSQSDNDLLCRAFSAEEVTSAFAQINPSKAPGFDGLSGHFFRSFWNIVGCDFVNLCLCLLNGTMDFNFVNRTIIVLIPKVDSPTLMKQFRPISLCSVIYKVVSKAIVNRLKPLMHGCIAENQCAFVPGRRISDNFLVAHELIHYLKGSKNGPNKGAAIKLDMEKAYDRVEWGFLLDVMLRMGFDCSFVNLVRKCISTVSFQVRINGVLSDSFIPERGLRQGDPLSPYLFLFCAQGLSALLLKAQSRNEIKGIRASIRGPRISHLLYADDNPLFVKNSMEEVCKVKSILNQYEKASGQKVNFEKSSIYFSPNTPDADRMRFFNELGVVEASEPGNYLGLPLAVGKGKRVAFNFIRDKTEKRIQGWTKRLLSFGGREVFIKSVVQALPAYAMSCYLIPDGVIEDIRSQARSYWWSGKQNERGWALVAWDKIWRLIQDENSLVFKVFKAKYFPSTSFFEAKLADRHSYAWASIMKAKEALREGFFWRVGIDSKVSMFADKWGDSKPLSWSERYLDNVEVPVGVGEFMIPGCARWDENKLNRVLIADDASKVLNTLIASVHTDLMLWSHHTSGMYSAKSGYNWLKLQNSPLLIAEGIWNEVARAKVLPKIKIFGWRLCHEAIPSGLKIKQAKLGDGLCPLCNREVESALHVLKDCPKSKTVLNLSGLPQAVVEWSGDSCIRWLSFARSVLLSEGFDLFLALLWNIWNRRNKLVHDGDLQSDREIIVNSSNLIGDYKITINPIGGSCEVLQITRSRNWSKPNRDEVKINVDGAFCKSSRIAAFGVVARDAHGMVLGGLARKIVPPFTTESTEALVFTEGIRFASENGWNNAIIEGDAISIVYRLSNQSQDFSTIGLLLNEARRLLTDLPSLKVFYVSRDANRVAHTLAQWALSNHNPVDFFLDEPECINSGKSGGLGFFAAESVAIGGLSSMNFNPFSAPENPLVNLAP
ncbi:hypothetical protein F3Y22_tig00110348pilonHSYRG00365 [Hibiscus syriacus]|uniref:Reverse transcriptase domain-containing protein n=1 Tax=Hibiscus syriacus TaxID=106335 RepID=A0A6A3AZA9_HIBSY|nr:hypothetical protein F3Y22_tig00110348pilonHSYRG00365 [Hibiscus syriacus]